MWKCLAESVRGTSHVATHLECQDACRVARVGEFLVLVAADGAGSASHAAIGATTACDSIIQSAERILAGGAALSETMLYSWAAVAHTDVEMKAAEHNVSPRELACTLLVAVLGPDKSAFAQIGDGVIVTGEADQYTHVFWPDSGEYQNTTYFLSESTYAEHLRVAIQPAVNEVALLSDGLQMLALKIADKSVHNPFFLPMFKALRAAQDDSALAAPLRTFLDSANVNARTDDDKTLILATRVLP
jgi:hypothetical protein